MTFELLLHAAFVADEIWDVPGMCLNQLVSATWYEVPWYIFWGPNDNIRSYQCRTKMEVSFVYKYDYNYTKRSLHSRPPCHSIPTDSRVSNAACSSSRVHDNFQANYYAAGRRKETRDRKGGFPIDRAFRRRTISGQPSYRPPDRITHQGAVLCFFSGGVQCDRATSNTSYHTNSVLFLEAFM